MRSAAVFVTLQPGMRPASTVLYPLSARRRAKAPFFLSPAAATLVFLAVRLLFGFRVAGPSSSPTGLAGEGTEPPQPTRVVAQISSVDTPRARGRRVPSSESELLDLLRRDGVVLFSSDEVDVLRTPRRVFSEEEASVIRVVTATKAKTNP